MHVGGQRRRARPLRGCSWCSTQPLSGWSKVNSTQGDHDIPPVLQLVSQRLISYYNKGKMGDFDVLISIGDRDGSELVCSFFA